jgi:hypothetical protein
MDNLIMAAKVAARNILPNGTPEEIHNLMLAYECGGSDMAKLLRANRDLQLDASRAHVARLERQLATHMTGDFR